MAYIDKIQVGGTNYDIQDSALKSAISHSGTDLIPVEQGYYAIVDGAETASANWCKTPTFVENVFRVQTTGISMFLQAFDKTGAYIGTWNGSEINKTYSNAGALYSINLEDWKANYPNYFFKLLFYNSGSAITPGNVYEAMKIDNILAGDVAEIKEGYFTRTNQLIDLNNPDFWNLNKTYTMTSGNGQVMSNLIPIDLDTDYYCAKDSSISQYKCKLFGYDTNGSYVSGADFGYFSNSATVNVSSVSFPTVKYLRFRCALNSSGDPGYPGAITYDQFRSYLTWINLTTGARVTDKYVPYVAPVVDLLSSKVEAIEEVVFPEKSLKVDGASLTEAELSLAKTKLQALERKSFDFAWQTDTHVFSNGTEANLLNLVSAANIGDTSFIVNTGDFINGGYDNAAVMKLSLAKAVGVYKTAVCDYFQLAGNHDDNSLYYINNPSVGKRNIIGYEDWFNMVVARLADYNIALTTNKRYFSKLYNKNISNTDYRFLAICLDSGDIDYSVDTGTQFVFGFKEEQLKWLINTLTLTQYNEYVMVFVHCPIDGVSTNETVHNLDLITGILEAFANHSSYSGSSSESGWEAAVSCDFTGKTGQHLVGVFQGHTHVDSLVTSNNVNYVTLDNGFVANNDASGKKDAVDYVNINAPSKTVNLIRLGGGDGIDRSFTFY